LTPAVTLVVRRTLPDVAASKRRIGSKATLGVGSAKRPSSTPRVISAVAFTPASTTKRPTENVPSTAPSKTGSPLSCTGTMPAM
jgi:hypothetical protein